MSKVLAFPESLPEFQRLFPDDGACATYMERLRWEAVFKCPKCKAAGDCVSMPFDTESLGKPSSEAIPPETKQR